MVDLYLHQSEFDRDAFEWLKKIPPHQWARSHFTCTVFVTFMLPFNVSITKHINTLCQHIYIGRAGSDVLLNNLCEVFNGKLLHARNKPIISCLEFIRQYLMKRICNVMKVMGKATGQLTPTATKLLEKNREASVQYRARWTGTSKFEVYGPWHDQHVVDMSDLSCTCRRWELTGIP